MEVIKQFLMPETFNDIKQKMFSAIFPWFLSDGVAVPKDGHHMLSHIVYMDNTTNSDFYKNLIPVIEKLNAFSLVRIKANLHYKTNKIIEHGYHTDFGNLNINSNLKSAVYYINTNNGYTKFKNGQKIFSEENKMIIFDAKEPHTGSSCTDEEFRIVINFNFFTK